MTTWLIHLTEARCEELLARATLGRLGVVVDGRPEIFPVNHVFDPANRSVAFPTNAGTKLRAALDWPWVAFEVDGVDVDADDGDQGGDVGWSVMVVGRAEEIDDPIEIATLETLRPARWRTGPGVQWLRIIPTKMTGLRISAAE